MKVLTCTDFNGSRTTIDHTLDLSGEQQRAYNLILAALELVCTNSLPNDQTVPTVPSSQDASASSHCFLITGGPGTGKSHLIKAIISSALSHAANVLLACPTASLVTEYSLAFSPAISCETVHAAFHIPVTVGAAPSMNWSLAKYQIVIVDEVSQLLISNLRHVLHCFCFCFPYLPCFCLPYRFQRSLPTHKLSCAFRFFLALLLFSVP